MSKYISNNQVVTPWNVKGEINYDELISQFGTSSISRELINRFETVTKNLCTPG